MPRRPDQTTRRIRAMHSVSDIGFRSAMEDRYVLEVRPQLGFFAGVYDGHGGIEAVELVAASLHRIFFTVLGTGADATEALAQAYREMEEQLEDVESGTTAVTIFLGNDALTFAHVGDGGILLVQQRPILLTRPHRVDDPIERTRIVAAGGTIEGGYVLRGHRGLMPTRSFGDSYFRRVGVTALPTMGERPVGAEDRYVVVACDGLFDVLAEEEIAAILLRSGGAVAGGEALRQEVFASGGLDNLTILVIEVDREDPPIGGRAGEPRTQGR
ncbi:MAG: PP2C family protein-serine/threonine phosphatase [candidate division NC10 bacterium]|nr:PP2C family protein-serine/threonine phosphatase [candidate division NC10 bacterium]